MYFPRYEHTPQCLVALCKYINFLCAVIIVVCCQPVFLWFLVFQHHLLPSGSSEPTLPKGAYQGHWVNPEHKGQCKFSSHLAH